jgi:hypothetical protein
MLDTEYNPLLTALQERVAGFQFKLANLSSRHDLLKGCEDFTDTLKTCITVLVCISEGEPDVTKRPREKSRDARDATPKPSRLR